MEDILDTESSSTFVSILILVTLSVSTSVAATGVNETTLISSFFICNSSQFFLSHDATSPFSSTPSSAPLCVSASPADLVCYSDKNREGLSNIRNKNSDIAYCGSASAQSKIQTIRYLIERN